MGIDECETFGPYAFYLIGARRKRELDFREIVDEKNWTEFSKFLETSDEVMEKDLEASMRKREELRKYLIEDKKLREQVKRPDAKILDWAGTTLFGGGVAAVDGTMNKFPMLTGVRCRIGVVATSYRNNSVERVLYISEREFAEKVAPKAEEFYQLLAKGSGISNLFLQGIMSYKERAIALSREEEWKFIHGTLVPLELRVPRIGHGAFEASLELAKRLVENKKCIGVISGSSEADFVGAGIVLEPGEYMFVAYAHNFVEEEMEEGVGNADERRILDDLADQYLSKVKVGVFRVGPKPYLLEAHEEYFDQAAALVIADSMTQSLRGFPLLIDYADSMCKALLSPDDFAQQIQHKMVTVGGISGLGYEISERMLRRR